MRDERGKRKLGGLKFFSMLMLTLMIGFVAMPRAAMAAVTPTAAPASHDFGNVDEGGTSATLTVTVGYTGAGGFYTLDATPFTFTTGTQFTSTATTCTAGLKIGTTGGCVASCTIDVVFKPLTTGALSDTLTINTSKATDPTVALSGTGLPAPRVSLSPTSWDFGNQLVGTTSASKTIVVTNVGSEDLTVSDIALAGADAAQFNLVSEDCTTGSPITPTSSCSIVVSFSPTTAGDKNAQIGITDDAADSPQTVPLSGHGTAPDVSLNPTNWDFGNQPVSTTSASKTITLTNSGDADLTVTNVALSGSHAAQFNIVSEDCTTASPIAPAGTCTIDVSFSPTTVGGKSAQIDISDDAASSPQNVPLSGTGTAADVSIDPTSWDFGNQRISTTSASKTITVTNTGGANLTVTSVTLTGTDVGEFNIDSENCVSGSPIAPAGTCTINVSFSPTTTGGKTAEVEIADNAISGSPQTVPLSGNGTAPEVSVDPLGWNFGDQLVTTTSASKTFTVTNSGGADLTVTNVALSGTDAAQFNLDSEDCTTVSPIAPAGTCTIDVSFTPATVGGKTAQIDITDDAADSPQAVLLGGNGIAPDVSVDPASWNFGDTFVGHTSSSKTILLTNTGGANLTVTNVALAGADAGEFNLVSENCVSGSPIAPSGTCSIVVSFSPASTGDKVAQVDITDDAVSGSPQTVSLSGKGIPPAPLVNLDPSSVNFGNQTVGTTSAAQAIILTNTGVADLTITSIAATGEFSQMNDCPISPATLVAGGHCTISATFSPTSEGDKAGSITITDDAAGSPHSAALSGTGTIAPVTVNLSMTKDATPNPTQCKQDVTYTIVASSTGTATAENVIVSDPLPEGLTLVSIAASQGSCDELTVSCNLGTLDVGATATITIVATPTAAGTVTNTATATCDGLSAPVSASVDLTVDNVNCDGGGGGGCSLVQQTFSAARMIPFGLLASLAALGLYIRRRR